MTDEEIIQMARQANLPSCLATHPKALKRFSELVAQHEREACAKLFEDRDNGIGYYEPREPAEIIRARGQA